MIAPGPCHSETMMNEVVEALVAIWDRLEVRLVA